MFYVGLLRQQVVIFGNMRSKIAHILYVVGTTIKDWAYRVDNDYVPEFNLEELREILYNNNEE
jgi:hypothetical protein